MEMDPLLLFLLSSSLFIRSLSSKNDAQIAVMGLVYCDICSNNSFSRHSYFLSGAEVRIDCKFLASSPITREQVSFTANRKTNDYGMYKLELPSVDGIACAEAAITTSCKASLVLSSSKLCNVPGYNSTSDEMIIKARQPNLCIYTLNALNFRPSKKDATLCGN